MKPQQEDLESCLDTLSLINLLGPEMVIDSGLKIHELGKLSMQYTRGGTQLFFGEYVPRGVPKVGSRERVFLEK